MAKLIMMVGNIGSGKSTYIKYLVKQSYINLSKDDIRYSIGAGKYIFKVELETTIHYAAIALCEGFLHLGKNVIIDETNMDKATRKWYLNLAKRYKYITEAIIMPKLSMKESVKRRMQSNHGDTPKEIWEEVFIRKEAMYEKPTKEEFDTIKEIKNCIICNGTGKRREWDNSVVGSGYEGDLGGIDFSTLVKCCSCKGTGYEIKELK